MPPRKRPHGLDVSGAASKRRREGSLEGTEISDREGSPGKNVRFPKNLVSKPHGSDPTRRSVSPMRSSLRSPQLVDLPNNPRPEDQMEALIQQDCDADEMARIARMRGRGRKVTTKPANKRQELRNASQPPRMEYETDTVLFHDSVDCLPSDSASAHDYVCTRMNLILSEVVLFGSMFPPLNPRHNSVPDALFKAENEQLIRYIGCLAMGGKKGKKGWQALLCDQTCREALVCGIVGRALKEKVFAELCFGTAPQLEEKLSKQEKEQVDHDGFFRTRNRADIIQKNAKLITDSELHKAVARITLQLEHILLPLWKESANAKRWEREQMRTRLAKIVEAAARLSQCMRKDSSSIYYWPPTFKDEEFEPARMECFNLDEMISSSPYDKKKVDGFERAVLREGHEHESEAIVRVVCFPGLVAYQQGGGDLAMRELKAEKSRPDNAPPDVQQHRKILASRTGQGELDGSEGFRTRVICKSTVLLQWGKQRLLTKEAGTSAHIDAIKSGDNKYEEDYEGFIELYGWFRQTLAQGEHRSPRSSWLGPLFPSSGISSELGDLTVQDRDDRSQTKGKRRSK